MNCPTESELWLHLDDAHAFPGIGVHLQTCERCRKKVGSLTALEGLLAQDEPLPEGLYERALEIPDRRAHRRWIPAAAAMAAAAVLVLAVRFNGSGPAVTPIPQPPRAEDAGGSPTNNMVPGIMTPGIMAPDTLATRVQDALRAGDDASHAFLDGLGGDALGMFHRFARENDVTVARAAIRRLGVVGRRESLPVLREAVAREVYRDVAATSLGQLEDVRAVPDLEAVLPDPHAMAAIATIGGKPAVEALRRRLRSAEAEEGALLLASIGRIDGDTAVDALLAHVADPVHGLAAWAALEANGDRLLGHLLKRAASPREEIAFAALGALERLAPKDAVPGLRDLLGNRSRSARAARVLARIDTPEAQNALLANLRAPGVRDGFRSAGPGMEARLMAGLDRGSLSDRLQRVDLLGLCGHEVAVARLEQLANAPAAAPHVVVALGRMGGDHAANALGRLAERTPLRRPAVDALGWTGSTAAVPILLNLASRERGLLDPVLRALAVHASPEAVTAIARLDPRGTRATRTLREMDRGVVVSALIAMLEQPDADVARRALRAIGHPVPPVSQARTRLH